MNKPDMQPDQVLHSRRQSHGTTREPILEPFLARYRYRFSLGAIRKLAAPGMPVKGFDIGSGYRGNFVRLANSLPGVEFRGGDVWVDAGNPNLLQFDFAAPPPLPFAPNVVTMHAVLEHLVEPERAVRYVYDVLAPGGCFLFTVPSNAAKPVLEFLSFRLGLVSRQEIEDHKQYFNRDSCLALLKQPGAEFRRVSHKYFQFGLNNYVVAWR